MGKPRVIDVGEPCRGNTGDWGRTVTYEFDGILGPMPIVEWESLPEPIAGCLHSFDLQQKNPHAHPVVRRWRFTCTDCEAVGHWRRDEFSAIEDGLFHQEESE